MTSRVFPSKKNIFIINNQLNDSIIKSIERNDYFNIIISDIDSLRNKIKKIKGLERENTLIIVDIDFYSDRVRARIKKIFLNAFDVLNPYILFIIHDSLPIEEQEKILSEGNFFYLIRDKKIHVNFYYFLILIFLHNQDMNRLNNYIIQSFQNIVDSHLVEQQKEKIEKLYKELERLSKIDTLTNVLNRRAFFEAMELEKARTSRDIWRMDNITKKNIGKYFPKEYSDPVRKEFGNRPKGEFFDYYGRFSCMMIDLDFFKQINDKYGHIAGDEVLRKLGELMSSKSIFREIDIVGRYGGEEFVVILPATNTDYAKRPANRLREQIKNINFNFEGEVFNVTISIGISEFNIEDKTCEDIIKRADKALYHAKVNGRDQVVVYEEVF